MAAERFDVVITRTFLRCLSLSSWVNNALTTYCEQVFSPRYPSTVDSDSLLSVHHSALCPTWLQLEPQSGTRPRLWAKPGSVSDDNSGDAFVSIRSPINTTTKQLSSSTISVTDANNRWTSLPDSENHFEKSECELISINLP
jgi:hypothetical protein